MKIYNKFKKEYCEACGTDGSFYPLDIDHLLPQKSRPELINEEANCITLCRAHHTMKGMKGLGYMANTYPRVKKFLIENGWEFCELSNKWRYFKS